MELPREDLNLNIKRWEVKEMDRTKIRTLSKTHQIPSFLAMLLNVRGYDTPEQIEEILNPSEELSDPFELKDMDLAVARIQKAIGEFERIAVYGDYDADGVTATAILFSHLETMGANVLYYIPQREEGYGMNLDAINFLHQQGVKLIVTVDNGISAVTEVAHANGLGIDVVITDHHKPQETLPPAVAVVDPHRGDCSSNCKMLCGAGVALKLLLALDEESDPTQILEEYVDLVAIGTVADVVPMTGENRIFVRKGLEIMTQNLRPGIRGILAACNQLDKKLTANALSFILAPRLNAAGRMGRPERAVRLLTEEDSEAVESLAEEICEENEKRKKVEAQILKEATQLMDKEPQIKHDRILVLAGEGWHHGVVGIVATRLTETYGKPCIILSLGGDEARGSGRSVEDFSLFDAVHHCRALLTKHGGHPMAVGLTMDCGHVAQFRKEINAYAAVHCPQMPVPKLYLDCKLKSPATLTIDIAEQLSRLEPYGPELPLPIFGLYQMQIEKITPVGNGGHLRLFCRKGGEAVTVMCFGMRPEHFPYSVGSIVDLAVTLELGEFRGSPQITVQVHDLRLSSLDVEATLQSHFSYESFQRREPLSKEDAARITPSREELVVMYRYFRKEGSPIHFYRAWAELGSETLNLGKLLVALDIFLERGLARCETKDACSSYAFLHPTGEKINIYESEIYQRIQRLTEKAEE